MEVVDENDMLDAVKPYRNGLDLKLEENMTFKKAMLWSLDFFI